MPLSPHCLFGTQAPESRPPGDSDTSVCFSPGQPVPRVSPTQGGLPACPPGPSQALGWGPRRQLREPASLLPPTLHVNLRPQQVRMHTDPSAQPDRLPLTTPPSQSHLGSTLLSPTLALRQPHRTSGGLAPLLLKHPLGLGRQRPGPRHGSWNLAGSCSPARHEVGDRQMPPVWGHHRQRFQRHFGYGLGTNPADRLPAWSQGGCRGAALSAQGAMLGRTEAGPSDRPAETNSMVAAQRTPCASHQVRFGPP